MDGRINIRSLDEQQLQQIPEGTRDPSVRYIGVSKLLVSTSLLQERAKFSMLGMFSVSFQLECAYPQDAPVNATSQLQYELVAYKDGAGPVCLSSGWISPFYDKMEDEFWVRCKEIGLWLATANPGTAISRPMLCNYSFLANP